MPVHQSHPVGPSHAGFRFALEELSHGTVSDVLRKTYCTHVRCRIGLENPIRVNPIACATGYWFSPLRIMGYFAVKSRHKSVKIGHPVTRSLKPPELPSRCPPVAVVGNSLQLAADTLGRRPFHTLHTSVPCTTARREGDLPLWQCQTTPATVLRPCITAFRDALAARFIQVRRADYHPGQSLGDTSGVLLTTYRYRNKPERRNQLAGSVDSPPVCRTKWIGAG